MKSKCALLIFPLFISLIFLNGCSSAVPKSDSTPTSEKPFGGLKDAHGCVLKDGYSWCEVKSSCIKLSEENCVSEESYKKPKRNYYLIEDAFAKKNDIKVGSFRLGITNLRNAHFRGVISGEEGVILAVKENNDWIIVVDTVYGKNDTYTCDEIAEHYFPADMITDCVTE